MRVTPAAYKLDLSIMDQKISFGIIWITCAVRTENFNIFHYFSPKILKIPFLQCKTSIGNNSSCIKDRAVRFAYNGGFSDITDRMV